MLLYPLKRRPFKVFAKPHNIPVLITDNIVKDPLKVFGDFKDKEKGICSIIFDMLTYIYSEKVFNTLHIEINHIC